MKTYALDFRLMEIVTLVAACNHAIDREHRNFVRILNCNGEAIRALESVREKLLVALREDRCNVELNLMETVQLYAACNMAWHYENDAKEKQNAECRIHQYCKAITELEDAREKLLAVLFKQI